MSVTLTIKDETTTGDVYAEVPLEVPSERITVRELIRERVYQEVQDFNQKKASVFRGLVQPTEAEQVLNGQLREYHLPESRQLDWKNQFAAAVEAFEQNGFFILINNTQAETLDQSFSVSPRTEVSFVKLTPLVGG